MLRLRLALVIAVSLFFVIVLGVALYWGSRRVEWYVASGQRAYEAFDRYEELSLSAYRHFKQRMDLLLVDNEATQADVDSSEQRLRAAMNRLQAGTGKMAPDAVDVAADAVQRRGEAERVTRLNAILDAGMGRFEEVERLRQAGKREAALLLLSKVLEDNIDREFEPLIDSAINTEHERALVARERLLSLLDLFRWISVVVASMAVVFAVGAGLVLFRGIRLPIEALMRGTDEIADGNLSHRITVASSGEFGYLAKHFNQMARRLEQQQHKLNGTRALLEHKVAERTLELDRVNRELQSQDHARRQFFADISHELRTPITVIRGEAEITLRGKDKETEEYKDALQRIFELSLQLGMVVNDLLFLARSETSNLQFEWEEIELNDLVARAVEDMRSLAHEKSISVMFEESTSAVRVRGDRPRLRQVLCILLDNSCRYSNPGTEIVITVRSESRDACVSIADQGLGVSAQDLEMIFERYYRSASARRSSDAGTGLGLPVAKAIVNAHGGHIAASINVDSPGTTFTVTLPRIGEAPATLQAPF